MLPQNQKGRLDPFIHYSNQSALSQEISELWHDPWNRCVKNVWGVFYKWIFRTHFMNWYLITYHEIGLGWVPENRIADKSTSLQHVQAMAWCHEAPSHYLSQCWPKSMPPYSVIRPQWGNVQVLSSQTHIGSHLLLKSSPQSPHPIAKQTTTVQVLCIWYTGHKQASLCCVVNPRIGHRAWL